MRTVYYIGGSPCSGKSTVAEKLAEIHNLYYFKVDNYLEGFLQKGADLGYEICIKQSGMSFVEMWMRDPVLQCAEELELYREMFPFAMQELSSIHDERAIIAEGAAFLPELMHKAGIDANHYISVTPSKEFQMEYYSKREWIPHYLEGCSDKETAFRNWMDRDALFAENVRKQCEAYSYKSIINDGSKSIDELLYIIQSHFGLMK